MLQQPALAPFNCQVCSSVNSSVCGPGADCNVTQMNLCNQNIQAAQACTDAGGRPLEDGRCVVPRDACESGGGTWDAAASACRNPALECTTAGGTWDARASRCLAPVDCRMSEWSPWGPCVDGVRTRTRSAVEVAAVGGAPCPADVRQAETCVSIEATATGVDGASPSGDAGGTGSADGADAKASESVVVGVASVLAATAFVAAVYMLTRGWRRDAVDVSPAPLPSLGS